MSIIVGFVVPKIPRTQLTSGGKENSEDVHDCLSVAKLEKHLSFEQRLEEMSVQKSVV